MKQILQNLRSGELEITDVPVPAVLPGTVLIKTRCTLISSGTERMLVSFAQSSLIGKAKAQPDKVKQVMDKIKTDGFLPTLHSVFSRLDEPLPLGYCNCGEVIEVGPGVTEFEVGDRVVSNGAHAEYVCVPKNLCAKVPDNVSDEEAAFTVLASIGLQGIRLINPTFGETIVVTGLGLIGLICVQILRRNGCRVIGIDLDEKKLEMARQFGAETVQASAQSDPVQTVEALTNGRGVDGVLVTASAKEDSIIHQAAQMCRKRGRIVLVGVVNLDLDRADFYEKELTFQVSCSYGPGRYDPSYEQGGRDYPYGLVRWTEQRNFEAILQGLSNQELSVSGLISERFSVEDAQRAYQTLTDQPDKMALILQFNADAGEQSRTIALQSPASLKAQKQVVAGLIGAGNFAKMTLLPAVKGLDIRLKTLADINPVSGSHAGRKFGFEQVTNDYKEILSDPEINTVFITTRHDLHAQLVLEALDAGKNVHVEKPLCLNEKELEEIRAKLGQGQGSQLLVGFNRRFSPHAKKIKSLTKNRTSPLCMIWTINAGAIPADVWIQNPQVGGGRIIGEGCHWIDFMLYLTGSSIKSVNALKISKDPQGQVPDDKMTISCSFSDGSIGTLHYFANGHKSYPKETFDVFWEGKILHLDNFRKLKGYGVPGFSKMNLMGQDKGHKAQFAAFVASIKEGKSRLISFDQIENVTLASFAAMKSAQCGETINLQ